MDQKEGQISFYKKLLSPQLAHTTLLHTYTSTMSTKHLFNETDELVLKSLEGVQASRSASILSHRFKVLYNGTHSADRVAVLSGGGSGHEPAHAGFVGDNMLTGAICGPVFASPSAKQVEAGCKLVPSDKGHILVVTNYTGDMLHFGLAAEKLKSQGHKVGIIKSADDVAVDRKSGGLVGRRGLAGTVLLDKIVGGAAWDKLSFDECMAIGTEVAENTATASIGLDYCHVPGRSVENHVLLDQNECQFGLGIHNEPGVKTINPVPAPESMVDTLLKYLVSQDDPERSFVKFKEGDEVILLANNLGGISTIEMRAAVQLAREQLEKTHKIKSVRVLCGTFMSSLNAPGFSITLVNLSNGSHSKNVLKYLDAVSDAPAWVNVAPPTSVKPFINEDKIFDDETSNIKAPTLDIPEQTVVAALTQASQNIIKAEPQLTAWDTEMGDGDCGHTIEHGCRALLEYLNKNKSDPKALEIIPIVRAVVHITEEDMGGTLGAIFGIFFASFLNALLLDPLSHKTDVNVTDKLVNAANTGLESLMNHTPARPGDRTVMDVLIPYVQSLVSTKDIKEAALKAKQAAEGTKKIKPRLGRAVYVGEKDGELPPDPGAWAVYELVDGFANHK